MHKSHWKSIIDMSIGKKLSTKSSRAEYLSQFPTFFHPYFDDIIDVENDGNCGFGCISSLLGWGKMHVILLLINIESYLFLFP